MSKSVRSDGVIESLFRDFLREFDESADERIKNALAWFAGKDDATSKERIAKVPLGALVEAYYKLDVRFRTVPPLVKQHMLLRLRQGRSKWGRGLPPDSPEAPQPWDSGEAPDELTDTTQEEELAEEQMVDTETRLTRAEMTAMANAQELAAELAKPRPLGAEELIAAMRVFEIDDYMPNETIWRVNRMAERLMDRCAEAATEPPPPTPTPHIRVKRPPRRED